MPTLALFSVVRTLPVVKVKISGTEHFFIIDTGVEHTIVSPEIVGSFNGSAQPTTLNGIGGTNTAFVIPKRIRLFGKELPNFIISDDFVGLRRAFHCHISALVGQDLLRQFSKVIFDNKNKTVKFED